MLNLKSGQALDILQELYAAGFQDTFLDSALYKIVERQIERDTNDLARIESDLSQFEHDYEMSSADFWQHYLTGRMADTADFMEWNVLCKSQQRIQRRLAVLTGRKQ